MPSYAAFLRGIGPGNPNMRNEKLRGVFEGLGLEQVASVISSGNLVFLSPQTDVPGLEARIQEGLRTELGIGGGTIVRSRDEIERLVDAAPFGHLEHGKATYLTATFFKHPLDPAPDPFPTPGIDGVDVVGYDAGARAVLCVSDTTRREGADFMAWLEKEFGKDITTRTWLTVQRVLKKLPT